MSDHVDELLRTELHHLVEGKSASQLMRQRVEHRLDRRPRTRAIVVAVSSAAVVLLLLAGVALAGGSSSKPTHVASDGATGTPSGSALGPQGGIVLPSHEPSENGRTTSGGVGSGPTRPRGGVSPPVPRQAPQPGAVPTTMAGSQGFQPPTTTTVTTPKPQRAQPAASDASGPYGVEVVGRVDGGVPKGWFRRSDDRGSTIGGPDAYGAMTESDWGGTPGPRYLSIGAVGNASQGSEPGRIFEYGAVGTDAVRVDLVLGDGRQIPATLGTLNISGLHFWVAGYWPQSAGTYGKVVATDAQSNTWQVDAGSAGYGFTP